MNRDYSLLPCGQQLGMFFIYKAKKNKLVADLFNFRKDIQMGFLDPYLYNFWKILQLADLCNCKIIVYEIDKLGSFMWWNKSNSILIQEKIWLIDVRAKSVGSDSTPKRLCP